MSITVMTIATMMRNQFIVAALRCGERPRKKAAARRKVRVAPPLLHAPSRAHVSRRQVCGGAMAPKRAAAPSARARRSARAARGARSAAEGSLTDAGGAVERLLTHLSLDELALILFRLPLAHDIALTATTCRLLRDAARLAFKARPYIGKVVSLCHAEKFMLAAHQGEVMCVAGGRRLRDHRLDGQEHQDVAEPCRASGAPSDR